MLFTSLHFAAFFGVTFCCFVILPKRYRAWWLLICSYVFYAYAHLPHLLILISVTVATWGLAKWVDGSRRTSTVFLSLAAVLTPLVYFKYGASLAALLDVSSQGTTAAALLPGLLLPAGISFYTFQAVSFLVDIHRHQASSRVSPSHLALYLAFFPQILAGPIERPRSLLPQLEEFRRPPASELYLAFKKVLCGLFVKLIVADQLAVFVDAVLARPADESAASLFAALILFSIQIYYDFFGYTLIATGVAAAFGVKLSLNFDRPYTAVSVRDFWRRWHISLSSWFRDYVYVPLGGKHTALLKGVLIVVATFVLSGIWHGASPNFAFWGLCHAVIYLVATRTEHARSRARSAIGIGTDSPWYRLWSRVVVFLTISITWLFFRVHDFEDIALILRKLLGLDSSIMALELNPVLVQPGALLFISLAAVTFALESSGWMRTFMDQAPKRRISLLTELAAVDMMLVLIVFAGDLVGRDFLYFRF